MSHSPQRLGFSLVELLVVILIIAVLAALLFPLDVGVRRLMLSPEEILGYARRGADWVRAHAPARAPQPERERALSRLLTAKERAEQGATAPGETPAAGASDERASPPEPPTPDAPPGHQRQSWA